jgi:PhzF family phenazine biosynthesis protein
MKLFQVDAFAENLFTGNPAAICILDKWLSDELLQKIAEENNLAETAFLVQNDNGYNIRWFTPKIEVDLCGHATLASAHVLFNHLNYDKNKIIFESKSGLLSVIKKDDFLYLNFPSDKLIKVENMDIIKEAIGIEPIVIYKGNSDYMAVFESQSQIENMKPDLNIISKIKSRGVIVTSKGNDFDFVSRFFAPQSGINEDPVTGSAHTSLIPYWSGELQKENMVAIQLSARKGILKCRNLNDRVEIGGKAITYLIGDIKI